MELIPSRYRAIPEMAYLSPAAENVVRYRAIMRYFYLQNELMNYQLYREDIFQALRAHDQFSAYTMEELRRDLDTLVDNKNLIAIQDPSRASTIAEYKSKQFRYMLSDIALEIERLIVRLENFSFEQSSVSANLFARIQHALEEMVGLRDRPAAEARQWWEDLQAVFDRMTRSYKDYLRDFYSEKAATLMQSVEFLVHKDHLLRYLQDFVRELQKYRDTVAILFTGLDGEVVGQVFDLVVRGELDIPRAAGRPDAQALRQNYLEKWRVLAGWFVDTAERPSECSVLLEATNVVITKILRNASLIVQMRNIGLSKKSDYQKFFSLFMRCETTEQAHVLSAHVFGVPAARRYNTARGLVTEHITHSTYDVGAEAVQVRPKVKTYKERRESGAVVDKSALKRAARARYLERLDWERGLVDHYIHGSAIDFSTIAGPVSPVVRSTLLGWVTRAHTDGDRRGATEYGRPFRLEVVHGERCILACEDGGLEMPRYILHFEDGDGQ